MAVSDGIVLDLTPQQEHVLTLAAFADDVDAPMRSLAATVAAGGEITTLHTLDVPADRPREALAREALARWGWQASNLRPGGYEPPALTD
jgi:hypothetical protein